MLNYSVAELRDFKILLNKKNLPQTSQLLQIFNRTHKNLCKSVKSVGLNPQHKKSVGQSPQQKKSV